jgi:hypothetical protein
MTREGHYTTVIKWLLYKKDMNIKRAVKYGKSYGKDWKIKEVMKEF